MSDIDSSSKAETNCKVMRRSCPNVYAIPGILKINSTGSIYIGNKYTDRLSVLHLREKKKLYISKYYFSTLLRKISTFHNYFNISHYSDHPQIRHPHFLRNIFLLHSFLAWRSDVSFVLRFAFLPHQMWDIAGRFRRTATTSRSFIRFAITGASI